MIVRETMFKQIVEYFKTRRTKKQIQKLAKLSYGIVFSEKYDLSIEKGVENFKNEIENVCKNQVNLLQAYSIINPILYNRIPIEEIDLNHFTELFNRIQNKDSDDKLLSLEIELKIAKLKFNLLIMDIYVEAGKREYEKSKYSFRGMVYGIENAKKAPVTSQENKKFKSMSERLDEIDEQINTEEQKR